MSSSRPSPSIEPDAAPWFLYALRCADGTIYTGVTTDLDRRVAEHNAGRGARYTRGRRPVHPIGAWQFPGRGAAQRAEARFRRLRRERKLALVGRRDPFAGADFCLPPREGGVARFCPRCGAPLETVVRPDDDRPRRVCTGCGRVHYRNAKPCAGAFVTRDGRVLLVKRAIPPYQGYWDIPGGFLEADEHPEAGALREVREETGLDIRLTGLLGFYVDRYTHGATEDDHCLNIYFLARVVGGRERPADDAAELAWFAPGDLPDEVAFEHAHVALADWVAWLERELGSA